MAQQTFTEKECKKFEEEANPHQWFLTADLLHNQAVELHARRGKGALTQVGPQGCVLGQWDVTNKAAFLLCAFALDKAFLVYEHPAWISAGRLHKEICNHKLVELIGKSGLIPYAKRDTWVLAAFEKATKDGCATHVHGTRVAFDRSHSFKTSSG